MARLKQLPIIRCGARRLVVPLPALRKMLEGQNDGAQPQKIAPVCPLGLTSKIEEVKL
ncbi:hypothetical protein M1N83_01635 [Dehalococcoidia bacterium]|nr:hypothetical protein [Dehalococcoidia bacterium]